MKRLPKLIARAILSWARRRPTTAVKLFIGLILIAALFLSPPHLPPSSPHAAPPMPPPSASSFPVALSFLMLFAGIATLFAQRIRDARTATSEKQHSPKPDKHNSGQPTPSDRHQH